MPKGSEKRPTVHCFVHCSELRPSNSRVTVTVTVTSGLSLRVGSRAGLNGMHTSDRHREGRVRQPMTEQLMPAMTTHVEGIPSIAALCGASWFSTASWLSTASWFSTQWFSTSWFSTASRLGKGIHDHIGRHQRITSPYSPGVAGGAEMVMHSARSMPLRHCATRL